MKKAVLFVFVFSVFCQTVFGAEESGDRYSVGLKVWRVSSDYWDADDTFMYGPTFSMDLKDNYWISAMGTFGSFDYSFGSKEEQDAEVVLGRSFKWMDIGIGLRYLTSSYEHEPTSTTMEGGDFGPMIYAGLGQPFGNNIPFGWYAGASWVPVTWGDWEELEHYNVEGGMYYQTGKWNATLGYRIRKHQGLWKIADAKGVATSIAYRF